MAKSAGGFRSWGIAHPSVEKSAAQIVPEIANRIVAYVDNPAGKATLSRLSLTISKPIAVKTSP
jgi:hypothetical protein